MAKEYFVKPEDIVAKPTHPGVLFAEDVLPNLDGGRRTIGEIATLLGVTRQTLHRVMAGQTSVTSDMAVRLGKLCGNGPELWLNMQSRYDAWHSARRLASELRKIPTLA